MTKTEGSRGRRSNFRQFQFDPSLAMCTMRILPGKLNYYFENGRNKELLVVYCMSLLLWLNAVLHCPDLFSVSGQ